MQLNLCQIVLKYLGKVTSSHIIRKVHLHWCHEIAKIRHHSHFLERPICSHTILLIQTPFFWLAKHALMVTSYFPGLFPPRKRIFMIDQTLFWIKFLLYLFYKVFCQRRGRRKQSGAKLKKGRCQKKHFCTTPLKFDEIASLKVMTATNHKETFIIQE